MGANDYGRAVTVIAQSRMIHPEWTPADHYSYLLDDEFLDEEPAARAVRADFGLLVWPWVPGEGDWECYRCGHRLVSLSRGAGTDCPMCGSTELHLSDEARARA